MRDDIDAVVRQGRDLVDQDLGALRHRRRRRQPHRVRVTAERVEVARDAAEVVQLRARYAEPVEAEQAVHEHDRERRPALAWPRHPRDALERHDLDARRSPPPREHERGRDDQQQDERGDYDAHPPSLSCRARGAMFTACAGCCF